MVLPITKTPVSAAEFLTWVHLPMNADKHFELIGGEMVEKMVANQESSGIALDIMTFVSVFVKQHGLGFVTGADGGYVVGNHYYIPDGAFVSKTRQPQRSKAAYNPIPPDLAVEVVSRTDSPRDVNVKIAHYLAAGTVVWVVYPDEREIHVHYPNQPMLIYTDHDTLDGGTVLRGFQLPLDEIFPAPDHERKED